MIELPFNPKRFKIDGLRKRRFQYHVHPDEQFTQEQLMRIQNAAHFTKQVFPSNTLKDMPSDDVRELQEDELAAWELMKREAKKGI